MASSKGVEIVALADVFPDKIEPALDRIKKQFPNALVFARTNDISELALDVGREHGINAFSIKQLVEDNLPASWLPPKRMKR